MLMEHGNAKGVLATWVVVLLGALDGFAVDVLLGSGGFIFDVISRSFMGWLQ